MFSKSVKIILQSICIVTAIKILLIHSYRSTDFEVHRNWLAITHSLPISQWYYDTTSEWTLDYPPFFAWFEYFLSKIAYYFDPEMLYVDNLYYASDKTILFQRLSIEVTDLVLILSLAYYFGCSSPNQTLAFLLCIFAPGFLIVDHIHFQYNGYLVGLYILSVVLLVKNHPLLSAFVFSFTMNSKHLFIFQAPFFLIYLLRTYCINNNSSFNISHFIQLGGIVLSTFFFSLYPILQDDPLQNLQQLLSRLFPFQRGLLHSYWAPNVWSIYATCDKLLSFLVKHGFLSFLSLQECNTANGLVGNVTFSILPSISSSFTILLILFFFIPLLIYLWKRPTSESFIRCSILATFIYFLFGWHVHEKAILPTVILAGLMIPVSITDSKIFFLLSLSGTVGLFPLLFTPRDMITEILLTMTYLIFCYWSLNRLSNKEFEKSFSWMDKWMVGLVVGGCCFAYIISPIFFKNLPFLPLLVISVTCAIVNCYVFYLLILQLFKVKLD